MAVKIDNLDDVIKTMAKMEKAVELEGIREARKRMRAIMRSLLPTAKKSSPVDTGELKKSVKVKSRSRRGKSRVRVSWLANYAGFVNFKKNQSAEGYATDNWKSVKDKTDARGQREIIEAMTEVIERHGVKVVK